MNLKILIGILIFYGCICKWNIIYRNIVKIKVNYFDMLFCHAKNKFRICENLRFIVAMYLWYILEQKKIISFLFFWLFRVNYAGIFSSTEILMLQIWSDEKFFIMCSISLIIEVIHFQWKIVCKKNRQNRFYMIDIFCL